MTEKRMVFIFQIVIVIGACILIGAGVHEAFSTITAKLAAVGKL
jgi:hypothetical protein